MASNSGLIKRLEALARLISFNVPLWIVMLVDGNKEDDPEVDTLLNELDVKQQDTVILIKRYCHTDSLPRLADISLNS